MPKKTAKPVHEQVVEATGQLDLPLALPFIVDELPMGIAVVDPGRRMRWFNRAMEALTGFERGSFVGLPCRHILRGNFCLERCPVLNMSPEPGAMCVEGNLVNNQRQRIDVRLTCTPIRDAQGRLAGFFETVEDIRTLRAMTGASAGAYSFGQLVGRSAQMEQIYRVLPMIAQSDSSVLLTGETGTGKDLVAEAIHQGSARAKGPFIKVNCGALPATLLESELFGHQKGAFTGAVENKPGRFRLAHNGTLFLAEIGDLPLALQVKLLTFLDDRIVHPLGSTKGLLCDVRVIAATHRDLERMVREGSFREDLLFRLNVVRLRLPPLRERRDDIRLLLDHFRQSFAARFKKQIRGFSAQALEVLTDYAYPGNVRELKNIVEYAANLCQEAQILLEHLPAYLLQPPEAGAATDQGSNYAAVVPPLERDAREAQLEQAALERKMILEALLKNREPQPRELEWPAVERKMIVDAIVKAQGRLSQAAAQLGWSRSRLYRKIKRYDIQS